MVSIYIYIQLYTYIYIYMSNLNWRNPVYEALHRLSPSSLSPALCPASRSRSASSARSISAVSSGWCLPSRRMDGGLRLHPSNWYVRSMPMRLADFLTNREPPPQTFSWCQDSAQKAWVFTCNTWCVCVCAHSSVECSKLFLSQTTW